MLHSNRGIAHYIEKLKSQFNSNMIMNWSSLHKCIMILILTLCVHFLWIGWKILIVLSPDLWQWVNLSLVKSQIFVNSTSTVVVFGLAFFCYYFQNRNWANVYLPHIVINIFILLMLADGFLVGIYSPATVFAFVCISGLGLILFNFKIIYFQLILAITIYCILIYCTYAKIIPYAPIFSQKLLSNDPQQNPFWIISMLYFIIPILIVCLVLCEILLTQWRHREAIIRNLSQTDPLTNLYNRRFFNEKLNLIQQNQNYYSIILIDIDFFKKINDIYGHYIGDEALRQVADIFKSHIRHGDILARYGGEEFIIALPDTDLDTAYHIAERCRIAIENHQLEYSGQKNIQLTASFGVASSMTEMPVHRIIHFADLALYHAKQHGRNQVQIHNFTQAVKNSTVN